MSVSKQELAQTQEIIANFRVNELHLLLTSFRLSKLGKKQELVDRALQLLHKPANQLHVIERVRQIQKSTMAQQRYNSQPYTYGSASLTNQSLMQNQGMRHLVNLNYDPRYVGMYPNHGNLAYSSLMNQNAYGYGAQQSHGLQPPQQSSMARNMKISNLPFYDTEYTIMELQDLPAQMNTSRPTDCKRVFHFSLRIEDLSKFVYRSEPVKLPRYEVQMRVFQLELDGEQPDAFPPQCIVYLDDQPVGLPSIIPTNKPNAEQKRLSRPVNLTPFIQHPGPRGDRPYRLTVQWQGDKRAWAVGVWMVKRVNTEILQERLLNNPNAKRPFAVTKRNIIRRLAGDEDDVQMDTIKVSLIDPLVKTRIKTPARSSECEHLQCFDLTNYLMMNEKRPGWKCAICDKNAHYSKLIVDEYYEKLINEVQNDVDEVELLRDGTWRVVQEECEMLSDSDNEMALDAQNAKPKPTQPTPTQTKKSDQRQEPEIVTLSDSEDEAESTSSRPQPTASAASANSVQNQASLPPSTPAPNQSSSKKRPAVDSNSSDDSIIILDDNDEQSVSPPQPSTAPPSVNSQSLFNNNVGTPPVLPRASSESAASTPPLVNAHPSPMPAVSSWLPNGQLPAPTTMLNAQAFGIATTSGSQVLAPSPQLLNTASNGFHAGLYRPAIKEAAEVQVAAELSQFLASVYQKNVAAAAAIQSSMNSS